MTFMDPKEFLEGGYLQELNRTFLHPLGLALEVRVHEDGWAVLGKIHDHRDQDPSLPRFDMQEIQDAVRKAEKIRKEREARTVSRRKALGYEVQPLENDRKEKKQVTPELKTSSGEGG